MLFSSSNDNAQTSTLPIELVVQIPCGAGFDRVRGGRLDVGAYEIQNLPPTPPVDVDPAMNMIPEGAATGAAGASSAKSKGARLYRIPPVKLP